MSGAAVLLYIVARQYVAPIGEPWTAASLAHPLGLDEFGRDLVATAYISGVHSLLYGLLCALAAMLLAIAAAFVVAFSRLQFLPLLVEVVGRVVDSVPVVIWVLMFTILTPAAPVAVSLVVFLLAVLPFLIRVLAGEFRRLGDLPFIEAARMQRLSPTTIAFSHLLPNSSAMLGPVMAQVCGLAVAIDGAIAVVGSANRSELSIGILLLRGKENALTHPHLTGTAVVLVLSVYALIWLAGSRVAHDRRGNVSPL